MLSTAVSVTPAAAADADTPPPLQLSLPAAEPNLPALHFPFYSSTALCAPYGQPVAPPVPFVKPSARPPRPFFHRHSASAAATATKRRRAADTETNTDADIVASQSSTSSAAPSLHAAIRSYRRHLPNPSIVESLRILTWPHPPTAHTAQLRATYLSLLPPEEQEAFQCAMIAQLGEAARALLAVLDRLEPLCSRPYELTLHRMRPSQWQLPPHPLLTSVVAPFVSSLGLLRDGEEWIVGEQGVDEVRARVAQARAELLALVADTGGNEEAGERTGIFVVETDQQQQEEEEEEEEQEAVERDNGESKYDEDDEADDERLSAASAALNRPKSVHPSPMPVRPMPTMPTAVRHSRSTFKANNSRSQPTQRPHSPPQPRADAADAPYSSRTEAGAHPKPLSTNVAGDRRTLPIALPRTFLSAAPTIDAAAGELAPFTVQPAVLDLGPLLVGETYTATLLLTNTSCKYARFDVSLPTPAVQSATSPPPLSLSFAFRRGALSAGLSKPLTAVILCQAVGQYEADVVVSGEGGSVRVSVCADCMDDAERWRQERSARDRLSVGELGLTMDSSLPGSLKQWMKGAGSEYGRVKQVSSGSAVEEEQKEQILSAAVLSRWRNRPAHN